ncbi:MAG: M23 family metallopeptidase [Sphingomonadales bacterium]|nr:M23 family metallopeptidase [Sphingomonadales bacterium]
MSGIGPRPQAPYPTGAAHGPGGRLAARIARLDYANDLAEAIGSARWARGFGVMSALIAAALCFWPSFAPLPAAAAMPIDASADARLRAAATGPLLAPAGWTPPAPNRAAGARMFTIRAAPERPRIDLETTFAAGDSVAHLLERAGAGIGDAERASALIATAAPLDALAPGTRFAITLGPRPSPGVPRPIEHLGFRARFDLALSLDRRGAGLALARHPLAVDDTPLRIRGLAGQSLFLSARAAGAPVPAIAQYLQMLDSRFGLDQVRPDDTFDIITGFRRSAGGDTQPGALLYAGLEHDGQPRLQLLRWGAGDQFVSAADMAGGGYGASLGSPVADGHITSLYGMRFHPILGYTRMHAGVDFGAPWGSPIYAVADGFVAYAGVHGGHGNYVRLEHGGGLGTGYGHMSRIAVSPGERVHTGEVIGYVGSTGLSTGPHLHYEVYEGGHTVDPLSVHFALHTGADKASQTAFRAKLERLLLVKPGAAQEKGKALALAD